MARMTIRWLARGGIAQLGLNTGQALVLMYLIDRSDRDGTSYPSQARIAAELNIGLSTAKNHLSELEARGLIVVTRTDGQHNLYTVTRPSQDLATPPGQDSATPPSQITKQVVDNRPSQDLTPKYLQAPEHGLPDLARSGPARASDSQPLRGAQTEYAITSESVQPQPPRHDHNPNDATTASGSSRSPRERATAGTAPTPQPRQTDGARREVAPVRAGKPARGAAA